MRRRISTTTVNGEISWASRAVKVRVSRETIKSVPPVDSARPIDRVWEEAYPRHLQQTGYWTRDDSDRETDAAQQEIERNDAPAAQPVQRPARRR